MTDNRMFRNVITDVELVGILLVVLIVGFIVGFVVGKPRNLYDIKE